MANGTFYADAVNGSDANDGLSEANAKQTLGALLGLGTGGGNIYYLQAGGNYTLTSTVTIAIKGDTTDGRNVLEGYTTTPGARDGKPTITSATNSVNLLTLTDADYWSFVHLNFTHTAGTRGDGINGNSSVSGFLVVDDCIFDGCANALDDGFGFPDIHICETEIKNSTSHGAVCANGGNWSLSGVKFIDNVGDGYRRTFSGSTDHDRIRRCEFRGNDSGYICTYSTCPHLYFAGNTFRGNDAAGLTNTGGNAPQSVFISDNVFYGNGTYGVSLDGTAAALELNILANSHNAYGSNTSGDRDGLPAGEHDVTLSADPFTSSTDSTPNATAGGGAALRTAASTAEVDIGAYQHTDAGGGGGGLLTPSGFSGGMHRS